MRAGSLRHRLVIQAKTLGSPSKTSTGASNYSWTTLMTVYGALEPLSGRRLESAQASWPQATVEALVRYRSEILDADTNKTPLRISYGGRFFPIGKVLNVQERNRELRLLCSQGAATT
jgi:SPP1 family predicted phage head-tail adaptor